jgi:hypothetical protein
VNSNCSSARSEEDHVTAESPLIETSSDRGLIDNAHHGAAAQRAIHSCCRTLSGSPTTASHLPRPFDNARSYDGRSTAAEPGNEFLLDGAPNNSIQGGNNIACVPPSTVQEFKIVCRDAHAAARRRGINVSLKSTPTTARHGVRSRGASSSTRTIHPQVQQPEKPPGSSVRRPIDWRCTSQVS